MKVKPADIWVDLVDALGGGGIQAVFGVDPFGVLTLPADLLERSYFLWSTLGHIPITDWQNACGPSGAATRLAMKNAQPAPAQCLIEHYSGTLRVQFSIGSNTWDYTARFPRPGEATWPHFGTIGGEILSGTLTNSGEEPCSGPPVNPRLWLVNITPEGYDIRADVNVDTANGCDMGSNGRLTGFVPRAQFGSPTITVAMQRGGTRAGTLVLTGEPGP